MNEIDGSPLVRITGVLLDEPCIGRLGGACFGSCTMTSIEPVASDLWAQNACWRLIVHRQPAVELLRAAMQGDVLEVRGVVRGPLIIVPRTEGRLDVLLAL